MTTETQAQFALRLGCAKSWVTQLKQAGRLVMTADGLVDVEASLARIEATESPDAVHQARARAHADARGGQGGAAPALPTTEPPKPPPESLESIGLRLKKAEADKREHEAEIARMERERLAGNLVEREVVDYVLADYATTLRSTLEGRADRLAPVLYPLQTLEEYHAAILEADEQVLKEMEEALKRKAEAFEAS